MALDIQDRNPVVQGAPVVKPNDRLFWFGRPKLILYLIHFTLFQVRQAFFLLKIHLFYLSLLDKF